MITFSESDAMPPVMPQSDALVISIIVANHEVKRVYVDNEALVSIFFMECFLKLGLKKEDLKLCSNLQSFTQAEMKLEGMISLLVTVRSKPERRHPLWTSTYYKPHRHITSFWGGID